MSSSKGSALFLFTTADQATLDDSARSLTAPISQSPKEGARPVELVASLGGLTCRVYPRSFKRENALTKSSWIAADSLSSTLSLTPLSTLTTGPIPVRVCFYNISLLFEYFEEQYLLCQRKTVLPPCFRPSPYPAEGTAFLKQPSRENDSPQSSVRRSNRSPGRIHAGEERAVRREFGHGHNIATQQVATRQPFVEGRNEDHQRTIRDPGPRCRGDRADTSRTRSTAAGCVRTSNGWSF